MIRQRLVDWLDARLARRVAPLDDAELRRPTVVLAPHPDDEVLGCGGTIARLRRADVPVSVLFLTDGSGSHPALMAPERLAEVRRDEGRNACARLGVDRNSIEFLGYPDGALHHHEAAAIEQVAARLSDLAPERVLWPHRADATADHLTTRRVGRTALQQAAIDAEGLGFPIWFWCRWPWIGIEGHGIRARLATLRDGLRHVRQLDGLAVRVDLDEHAYLAKREALEHHRSQITRLIDDPRWQTLADIANGDYLARLLRPVEWFEREVDRSS